MHAKNSCERQSLLLTPASQSQSTVSRLAPLIPYLLFSSTTSNLTSSFHHCPLLIPYRVSSRKRSTEDVVLSLSPSVRNTRSTQNRTFSKSYSVVPLVLVQPPQPFQPFSLSTIHHNTAILLLTPNGCPTYDLCLSELYNVIDKCKWRGKERDSYLLFSLPQI